MDRILIVDDMQQNIELMTPYLESSGYEVFSATSGSSALKKAKMLKPALIILDLIMPEISGYDICKRLKADPETRHILILVVTALDSKDSKKRAFELGADDFMVKPFDKSTLISKIKALFRLKNLSDELEKQYAQVKEQNAQMELQMKMARQVQQALIEEYHLVVNDVSLTSTYRPALDIGGDMYDIFCPNDNAVCIFMSDVSGHGISAALLTAMLKMMFKNAVIKYAKPDSLLAEMNKSFCSVFSNSDIGVYACAFYTYIDTKNKRIIYSNAGHQFPIFVDASENEAFELNLGGVPLGLMEDSSYELKALSYEKEDMILFHTDGLCDSFYKESPEEFLQILKDILLQVKEDTPSQEVLNEIMDYFYNTDEKAKYENDDVSMILCRM